ncbi:hypothetical protein E1B28_000210 [Marasmius oreades]|uniref:Uncharacterized protein n=1 Tax=Marasmius oreades TaxID=181124 RepID=A0A9P8ADX3_9AGAR|nr:uncharacterized protein E1B28_000210 [Marasmius oreades]KAG7098246.1 hypothetical protein E1B28_000210 [Marasmius oreades]
MGMGSGKIVDLNVFGPSGVKATVFPRLQLHNGSPVSYDKSDPPSRGHSSSLMCRAGRETRFFSSRVLCQDYISMYKLHVPSFRHRIYTVTRFRLGGIAG